MPCKLFSVQTLYHMISCGQCGWLNLASVMVRARAVAFVISIVFNFCYTPLLLFFLFTALFAPYCIFKIVFSYSPI